MARARPTPVQARIRAELDRVSPDVPTVRRMAAAVDCSSGAVANTYRRLGVEAPGRRSAPGVSMRIHVTAEVYDWLSRASRHMSAPRLAAKLLAGITQSGRSTAARVHSASRVDDGCMTHTLRDRLVARGWDDFIAFAVCIAIDPDRFARIVSGELEPTPQEVEWIDALLDDQGDRR